MKHLSRTFAAAALCGAAAASPLLAHPGPRIWIGSAGGNLVTYGSNNDLTPTTFAPNRVFVGGIDEDTLTANGILAEYPVAGTGIYASEFPGYQVRTDGSSGIDTGSSFSFDLGPLLVFDSTSHTFKTTQQLFGNPGPAPQFAAVIGSSIISTGPGITAGVSFFSYNTPSDHAHLVTTLLGNGSQTVDGPQAVYAVPLQLSGAGQDQSLPYYVLLGRNISVDQPVYQDALATANAAVASSVATWITDVDGNWDIVGNWFANLPSAPGAQAIFGGATSAPRTVTINSPRTVGRLTFDSSAAYTIGGATLGLTATSGNAIIETLSGTHFIAAPLQLNSDTTISLVHDGDALTISNLQDTTTTVTKSGAGRLEVNRLRAAGLNIAAGTVAIASSGIIGSTSKIGALTIAGGANPTGNLDLHNNDLVVGSGTIATSVIAWIKFARDGGSWDQPGITSHAAKDNPIHNTTLAVLSGAEYSGVGGNGGFSGLVYLPGDTLVKYTWYGDTDLNGVINFDDYTRIDQGFNLGRTGWLNGDFDYSGVVGFDDYSLIDLAFNTQSGTLLRAIAYLDGTDPSNSKMDDPALQTAQAHFSEFGPAYARAFLSAVPESASGSLLVFAATGILRRRRHVR